MTKTIEQAIKLIRPANRVAIATHVKPDGDAIGSLLASGLMMQSLGKQTLLLCENLVPSGLRFLPGSDAARRSPGDFEPDLLLGVDANEAVRLGKAAHAMVKAGMPTVNIDHHITNDNFGTVNLVDTDWVAATEGVLALIDAFDIPLNEDMAFCLLTGLVTDTRGFRTPNVNPTTMTIAARLMAVGADLPRITALALDRTTLLELTMQGVGMRNMQLADGVVWTTLPLAENPQDVAPADLASRLLGLEEANVAAVFRERKGGNIELSLRAKPGYDVAGLAVSIGGGGHSLAAGASIKSSLAEVLKQVGPLLEQAAKDASSGA